MRATTRHWTERSIADFVHKISADFVTQIETRMDTDQISRKELAYRLRISMGRVSQVLNNPGNLTMKNVVQYSRILGMKVAIVAYDDGDAQNENGPINSEIFTRCWQSSGKPTDFFSLASQTSVSRSSADLSPLVSDTTRTIYIPRAENIPYWEVERQYPILQTTQIAWQRVAPGENKITASSGAVISNDRLQTTRMREDRI